ncbi:MAG: peptide chain release factor N(5)-glutamine methyltransferase [Xanthomonadales bacterium]|nr:peptide chain release factor N(5)-glutamine methyltransferase [Gammaproteobacteria bacterium]MBT8053858.1 peptide chain release factor N(5)-glutamine methyltransferase [Gammaproteobacteria bacterium]NND58341.1 peptide chain release factor N(5)-glutamine methyltransferase [Xanthomonadales bacterium]NNK51831.1 peptide chain release factor N(5)-glutamine methyltransferase [Xanthomonadales bacterium]
MLKEGRYQLAGLPAGALEAELLLSEVLRGNRAWLFANPEHSVNEEQRSQFRQWVQRRKDGEPLAYLTGRREFWSLALKVTPDVLIPRHETELLVEVALNSIPEKARWRIADLGTGSGAIALALAVERPLCEVHATDISKTALEVARANVKNVAPGRVTLHRGSWLEPLGGRFHVIVSNPPYIASDDVHLRQGDCRFEPGTALTPGTDGLSAIRTIARAALPYLESGGLLAFEHGFEQGAAARSLLSSLGYGDVETIRDLEGLERVTTGRSA